MNRWSTTVLALALLMSAPVRGQEQEGRRFGGKPEVRIGANLHAMWMWTDRTADPTDYAQLRPDPDNAFVLNMARLEALFSQGSGLSAKLQGDFDQLMGKGKSRALLRDAWVRFRPWSFLELKMGQFKRPFSRWELRSMGKLETINRGPSNAWLIEALGYGDRDLGAQLGGQVGESDFGLQYALGIFNGTGRNGPETDPDGSKDLVARVAGNPARWLSLGLNGSLKLFDPQPESYAPERGWAAGADARLELGGLRVLAEGLLGENHNQCLYTEAPEVCRFLPDYSTVPYSWSAAMMVSYNIPIYRKWRMRLQPVVKAEYLVPDHEASDFWIATVTPGLNLRVGRYLRFMAHGEFTIPGEATPDYLWLSENRFMFQVAFDR